jgi:hypothetical protein
MSKISRRIEITANIAIIVTVCLIALVIVRGHLLDKSSGSASGRNPNMRNLVGTKLSIPGVDWLKSRQTLVLTLQTGCHFCSESASFYRQLSELRAKGGDFNLVAVFPQGVDDAKKYLGDRNIVVDEVIQSRLDSLQVSGTPTLLLANGEGLVTKAWVGKLPSEMETEVMKQLE